MIAELERRGIPSVYLRNHEKLPDEVGNDVDLLVPASMRSAAAAILGQVARDHGWSELDRGHFGPLAVYFADLASAETLHVDLFDRLEWHFLEFADATLVLGRRRFNGIVHIPAEEDEIYLNLATRLIYQGNIREKHRIRAMEHVTRHGEDSLSRAFREHLGDKGETTALQLRANQWLATPAARHSILRASLLHHAIRRPWRAVAGALRYGTRIARKIIHPPGRLIVFEGADGVGKSTVLDAVIPWCSEWCAGRTTYGFHWKPVRIRCGPSKSTAPVDPRSSAARPPLASLVYLCFHVLGFWWGWIFKVRPLLTKSHCVVGDRYSFDLFLDPSRFRLKLPDGLCALAARLTPRPDVTVALIADPQAIHSRKPELTVDEIRSYQQRWQSIARERPGMLTVSADASPEEVILKTKQAILGELASHAKS